MDSRKLVLRETAVVAIGQVICVAAMIGICALLGLYSRAILLGGIFGGILAVLNFFFMAISAMMAADKAESQNVAGGKATVQLSFIVRMAVLFIVLFALIKSGLCDALASVLPLVFTRPIISVGEFFRKSGEPKT
jgi:predicted Co/Zn/Cd cation transporter (cation efflux family)